MGPLGRRCCPGHGGSNRRVSAGEDSGAVCGCCREMSFNNQAQCGGAVRG